MCAARNKFSEPGIHLISATGVLLMMPYAVVSSLLRICAGCCVHTFLFSRVYRCEIGSHQIISPVENPMITSKCDADFVTMFTS